MRPKLLNEGSSEVFSPLIDVVFNALAAMFIIFVVYVTVFQSSGGTILPIDLLVSEEVRGVYQKTFIYGFPTQHGNWPRTYEIVEGRLPEGLKLLPEKGILFGIPRALPGSPSSQEQNYRIRIKVTAADGSFDEESYSFVFQEGWIPYNPKMDKVSFRRLDSLLLPARVGIPYEEILGVQGGVGPFNWTLQSGNLPRGLFLKDGKIQGTPQDTVGNYSFSVKLEDNSTWFASEGGDSLITNYQELIKTFNLKLNPALGGLQTSLFLPEEIRQGAPIDGSFLVNTGLFENEIIPEQVPEGLQFDATTGSIKGVIRDTGEFVLSIRAKDPLGIERTASQRFQVLPPKPSFSVFPASFFIEPSQQVELSVPYQGAVEPVSWQIQGDLPEGLTFRNGRIRGQAVPVGQYSLTITGVDAAGNRGSAPIELNIQGEQAPLELATSSIPAAIIGLSYNFVFSARGGTGNYNWNLEGELPEGLIFDNNRIYGTPNVAGNSPIRATVTSGIPEESRTGSFDLRVIFAESSAPEIITSTIPPVVQGEPYKLSFAAEKGVGQYSWELSGRLPAGLFFIADGIQGTASQSNPDSTWLITAKVIDEAGQSDERTDLTLNVLTPDGSEDLEIRTNFLPRGFVGITYQAQVIAIGGTPPYTFKLQGTTLDTSGLTLTTEGLLEGVPTTPGNWKINVIAADQKGTSSPLQQMELNISQTSEKEGKGRIIIIAVLGILLIIAISTALYFWRRLPKNIPNSEKNA